MFFYGLEREGPREYTRGHRLTDGVSMPHGDLTIARYVRNNSNAYAWHLSCLPKYYYYSHNIEVNFSNFNQDYKNIY